MPDRIRVLAVARMEILRDGLSALIDSHPDMDLVGASTTADDALRIATDLLPLVILVDLDLPSSEGIAIIRGILAANDAACPIGLITNEWDEVGREALQAGAWSCVAKDRLMSDLAAAIRRGCQMSPRNQGG